MKRIIIEYSGEVAEKNTRKKHIEESLRRLLSSILAVAGSSISIEWEGD
jgi:hypothetical protein